MEFEGAGRLSTDTDVINIMNLFVFMLKIFLPILILLMTICLIGYIKKLLKQRKEKKKQQKIKERKQERINKLFENDAFLMKQLNNLTEPEDMSLYRNLYMEFDTNGKVITSRK